MKKLITHSQGFHADDVIAYAILKEVLTKQGESWELVRSRDPEVIKTGDIVFDIGDVYDPATNRYDHHMRGKAGARENGIYHASAGLIWKHFGKELCSNDAVWEMIDRGIICEIDAIDNGQTYMGSVLFKDAGYTSLGIHIANFEQNMFETKTDESLLMSFESASEFARGILTRAIHSCEALNRAYQEVTDVYNNSTDKKILVFKRNYSRPVWKYLSIFPEAIYAVYPNEATGTWKVETVPVDMTIMESRKLFPDSWRGKNFQEFSEAAGVPDGIFCHNAGFLLGTESLESALKLAKIALEA